LEVGDLISGFGSNLEKKICRVEAIGSFGSDEVYGNYTASHYLFETSPNKMKVHGSNHTDIEPSNADLYDVVSDCPLVEDETGNLFGPLASDFCGADKEKLTWSQYLLLHKAILRIVLKTGGFWFNLSSYKNMETVKKLGPKVCKQMIRCMKNIKNCDKLESASQKFVNKALTDTVKAKTMETFTGMGTYCNSNSVSSIITSGLAASDASCSEYK